MCPLSLPPRTTPLKTAPSITEKIKPGCQPVTRTLRGRSQEPRGPRVGVLPFSAAWTQQPRDASALWLCVQEAIGSIFLSEDIADSRAPWFGGSPLGSPSPPRRPQVGREPKSLVLTRTLPACPTLLRRERQRQARRLLIGGPLPRTAGPGGGRRCSRAALCSCAGDIHQPVLSLDVSEGLLSTGPLAEAGLLLRLHLPGAPSSLPQ